MKRRRAAVWVVALAALFVSAGCSGDSSGAERWPFQCMPVEAPNDPATDCDPSLEEGPETTQACGMTVYGTPETLRQTPREAPGIEELIVHDTNQFVASTCQYQRVRSEIRTAAEASILFDSSSVPVRPPRDKNINIELTPEMYRSVEEGTAEQWACLNDYYGAEVELDGHRTVRLEFDAVYDDRRLAELYEKLPGVASVLSVPGARHYTTCLQQRDGSTRYVFGRNFGDCPAGCIHSRAEHFVADSDGLICQRGSYDSRSAEESGAPRPEWLSICNRYSDG